MESSNLLRSRKRKQPSSQSHPFFGVFTRSKSQIFLHLHRSGRSRTDKERNRHHGTETPQVFDEMPHRKPRALTHQEDQQTLTIKDLRTRRVFSPASFIDDECGLEREENSSLKDGSLLEKNEEKERDSELMNICVKTDENEMEDGKSDMGFCCRGQDLNSNLELDVGLVCSDKRNVVNGYSNERKTNENGGIENLSEECIRLTPPEMEEECGKNGEILNGSVRRSQNCVDKLYHANNIEKGNDCISKSKLDFNLRIRRKVFKSPSSFSYRRLLPFLMDTAKDNSCVPKIKKVNVRFPCKVQNVHLISPNLPTLAEDHSDSKVEGSCVHSNVREPLENGQTKKYDPHLPCEVHDLVTIKPGGIKLAQSGWEYKMQDVEQRCHEDGVLSNRADDSMEEHLQMTPPDADIFNKSKVDDGRANVEDNNLQAKHSVIRKQSNGSMSRNDGSVAENSHPDLRKDSISKRQLVLNRCSRPKVFKIPSSASYRRLLPFLMDIANNGASKTSQHPKSEKVSEEKPRSPLIASPHEETDINKLVTESFCKEHHIMDKEANMETVALTFTDCSSDDTYPSFPIAVFTSINGSSNNDKQNLVLAEKITETHLPLDSQLEGASLLEQVKTDSPKKLDADSSHDILMCGPEVKLSSVSLCSAENHETLHRNFDAEVSQLDSMNSEIDTTEVSQHISINTEIDPADLRADGHKDDRKLVKTVTRILSENINEPRVPLNSQVEKASLLEQVQTDNTKKLESEFSPDILIHCPAVNHIAVTVCSAENHESLHRKFDAEVSQHDSVNTEIDSTVLQKDCHKDDGNLVKTVSLNQNPFPLDTSDIPFDIRRGILKRNRQGCRGLCKCLNCASFRLHAERAFEFSRNQMQDSKEVAMELIEELTNLRNVLQKSVADASNFTVVPINQVKEACGKSLRTEQLAKQRLSQMSDDLNVHCRIPCLQRPRVTFASNVEKQLFQKHTS